MTPLNSLPVPVRVLKPHGYSGGLGLGLDALGSVIAASCSTVAALRKPLDQGIVCSASNFQRGLALAHCSLAGALERCLDASAHLDSALRVHGYTDSLAAHTRFRNRSKCGEHIELAACREPDPLSESEMRFALTEAFDGAVAMSEVADRLYRMLWSNLTHIGDLKVATDRAARTIAAANSCLIQAAAELHQVA